MVIILEGWVSCVIDDEMDVIEAIRENMYVMVVFLCIDKC